jgi:hypothetical protein
MVLLAPLLLEAEVKVKVKGSTLIKKKKPTVEEARLVSHSGKIQAIKKYAAGVDNQKLKLINDLLPTIEGDISNYVLDVRYLNEGENVNGYWEQLLEVTVDDAQLELLINQRVQNTMSSAQDVYMSFVYVAREVSSVEAHDATVQKYATSESHLSDSQRGNVTVNSQTDTKGRTDIVVDQSGKSTVVKDSSLDANLNVSNTSSSQSASIRATGSASDGNTRVSAKVNANASEFNSDTNVSGSSREKEVTTGNATLTTQTNTKGISTTTTNINKNDAIQRDAYSEKASYSSGSVTNISEGVSYRAYNPGEVDAKVTELFNKANFSVVPAYEADISYEKFAYDFAALSEISSSTQKEATDAAREAGLDFLAVATLDVGREGIDSVTGSSKVYVKVNGYIMDLRKKFAVKICSVGPVQYSGYGDNPTVAKTNALIEASTHASRDLVDQLRIKIGN